MSKPVWYRWLRVYVAGGSIIGGGVLLLKYTTPTDEEIIKALSPELRLQYEKERDLRRKEQQELMRIALATAKSEDPIWKTGPIQSPLERQSLQVANREQFEREKADLVQKGELDKVREELEAIRRASSVKTEAIVEEKKKSGWW